MAVISTLLNGVSRTMLWIVAGLAITFGLLLLFVGMVVSLFAAMIRMGKKSNLFMETGTIFILFGIAAVFVLLEMDT